MEDGFQQVEIGRRNGVEEVSLHERRPLGQLWLVDALPCFADHMGQVEDLAVQVRVGEPQCPDEFAVGAPDVHGERCPRRIDQADHLADHRGGERGHRSGEVRPLVGVLGEVIHRGHAQRGQRLGLALAHGLR